MFQPIQGEHVSERRPGHLGRLVAQPAWRCERRANLVLRAPILQFPELLNKVHSGANGQRDVPLHLADSLHRLLFHNLPLSSSVFTRPMLLMLKLGLLNP